MISLVKKRILVTGANGFVGSNAVHYFVDKGAKVTAVVSPNANKGIIKRQLGDIKEKITIKKLDLLSPSDALEAAKDQDIVLHFAAIDGNAEYKKKYSAEIFSKNMRMVLNMLEASVKESIKTFLLISSTDIYTPSTHRLITESSPIDIHWDKNIDGYQLAKWTSELAAKEFGKQYDLNIIVVRPSNLYGPRDEFQNKERMRVIPSIINKVFTTKDPIVLWGKKKQLKSFLYIDDFLFICSHLLQENISSYPLNIASKNTISLGELAKQIIKTSNRRRKVITDRKKTIGALPRKFNLVRLEKIIPDFEETALEEGLKKTVAFYKENYLH